MAGSKSRIIPADAGSTQWINFYPGFSKDHPRGCGEHPHSPVANRAAEGSSPRMRGAPRPGLRIAVEPRIIPTNAGNTSQEEAVNSLHNSRGQFSEPRL